MNSSNAHVDQLNYKCDEWNSVNFQATFGNFSTKDGRGATFIEGPDKNGKATKSYTVEQSFDVKKNKANGAGSRLIKKGEVVKGHYVDSKEKLVAFDGFTPHSTVSWTVGEDRYVVTLYRKKCNKKQNELCMQFGFPDRYSDQV